MQSYIVTQTLIVGQQSQTFYLTIKPSILFKVIWSPAKYNALGFDLQSAKDIVNQLSNINGNKWIAYQRYEYGYEEKEDTCYERF